MKATAPSMPPCGQFRDATMGKFWPFSKTAARDRAEEVRQIKMASRRKIEGVKATVDRLEKAVSEMQKNQKERTNAPRTE